jgi:hypothetical protein
MKARAILIDGLLSAARSNQTDNYYEVNMTSAREPDDRGLDRTLRSFDRRISRLEDTQVTGRELNDAFGRVYDEIDALEEQMNARFDALQTEMRQEFASLNTKFDLMMRRLSGESNL